MTSRLLLAATATVGVCLAIATRAAAAEPASAPASQPSTQPSKELTLDLGGKVTMKLAAIPAGKFTMGSPKDEKDQGMWETPQHEVTISKPFFIGITGVTQAQWKAVMDTEPWMYEESGKQGPDYPAGFMSWERAQSFCEVLSKKTGKTVRLPTEAEREYACRAGSKTRFCYGDDDDYSQLADYAWYQKNASAVKEKYAHEVAKKKPNAWGLYDMHGNLYEWCSDFRDDYDKKPQTDPVGPTGGTSRVLRGACWYSDAKNCRSAARSCFDSESVKHEEWGFRVVVEAK